MDLVIVILVLWTCLALCWWFLSIYLVCAKRPAWPTGKPVHDEVNSLTLFKPVPKAEQGERASMQKSLQSWIAQMDQRCELLLGCQQSEWQIWRDFCSQMQRAYPHATIKQITHPQPLQAAANPKISWMQHLHEHATGELWFWCDADMIAPENAINSLFRDYQRTEAGMVTSPYKISCARGGAAILDTLYVNVEFLPGVLLLERQNKITFGLGAGMLFAAKDFHSKVDMTLLGRSLADDFHLGRMLQPVRLASSCLSTTVSASGWRSAFSHYRRWQKTVRWNQPAAYAAQLLVLPLSGWLLAMLIQPQNALFQWGFVATILIDWLAAQIICYLLDCRLTMAARFSVPVWSLARVLVFVSCWLPIGVRWRNQHWSSPLAKEPCK